MNVLFHINPVLYSASIPGSTVRLSKWYTKLQTVLADAYPSSTFHLILSKELAAYARKEKLQFPENTELHTLEQNILTGHYQFDILKSLCHWQKEQNSDSYGKYLANLYRKCLQDFTPDLIITDTPVPFLQDLYPDALILHLEYSLFSRAPYPKTFFLDPWGRSNQAFNSRFAQQINELPYDPENLRRDREKLTSFRNLIFTALHRSHETDRFVRKYYQKYRMLFILPLGTDRNYEIEAHSVYPSQLEFLEHVMSSVPPDIGIILTQHPVEPLYSEQQIDVLKLSYPNLIHEPISGRIANFSQVLLSYIDGAVVQFGTIGLQSAFLNRYLISPCGYFSGIADVTDLKNFSDVTKKKPRDRDNFFLWNMSHYAIPEKYLCQSAFLRQYIENMRKLRAQSAEDALRNWNPITPDGGIYDFYMDFAQKAVRKYHVRYEHCGWCRRMFAHLHDMWLRL